MDALNSIWEISDGIATAFLNMVRNTANVTGVGLATTIVAVTMASMGHEPTLDVVASAGDVEVVKAAFTQGLRTAYIVMSSFLVIAIVLSLVNGEARAETLTSSESSSRIRSKV